MNVMIKPDIWADTKSVSRIYFLTIDALFRYINDYPDDVIEGYVGVYNAKN